MKFFQNLFEKRQEYQDDEPAVVIPDASIHNITEGSEFLDDAIRMKEQPFMHWHTKKDVAPGSAETLMVIININKKF